MATMAERTELTERDSEILEVLATRVRCLSVRQVAAYWWSAGAEGHRNACARLRKLTQAGWLHSDAVLARPLPTLHAPLAVWAPEDPCPNFATLSYALKSRFISPVANTPIVFAARLAASRFGGNPGRAPRRAEATHDLGLAQVFLKLLRERPNRAKRWIAESELARGGSNAARKIPDAMIRSRGGQETAIEFGGEYSKAKLTAFHEDCAARERGYELW